MTRNEQVLLGSVIVAAVIWLLFTHWEWGVSVLLLLILSNQGKRS